MGRRLFFFAFIISASYASFLHAYCCNGDGCPNSLGQFVDAQGLPTGKYCLFGETPEAPEFAPQPGPMLNLDPDISCDCKEAYGPIFPSPKCPHCVEAKCPNPDCRHSIFQHTCHLNVRAEPGMAVIKVREK